MTVNDDRYTREDMEREIAHELGPIINTLEGHPYRDLIELMEGELRERDCSDEAIRQVGLAIHRRAVERARRDSHAEGLRCWFWRADDDDEQAA